MKLFPFRDRQYAAAPPLALMLWLCFATMLAPPSRVVADQTVGLMVYRSNNVLAWNAVDRRAALVLACDTILREYVGREEGLSLLDREYTNGIQRGVGSGLYFLDDATFEAWRELLEADIYVELNLSEKEAEWVASTAERSLKRSIERPYKNPKATAAALVELIFEAGGVAMPEEWAKELADPETENPALFIEWAQWIGYRPHWAHHAPWTAPRRSAQTIIDSDPRFKRGMAWALPMMLRPPAPKRPAPSGVQYFKQVFQVLDSPYHRAVDRFFRQTVTSPDEMRLAISHLNLPMLELESGFEMGDDAAAGAPTLVDPHDGGDKPSGKRLRENIIHAFGGVDHAMARRALVAALREDEAAEVRSAAAAALAHAPAKTAQAPLERALREDSDDAVRAAALRSIADHDQLDMESIRAALTSGADSRATLASVVRQATVPRDQQIATLKTLLTDDDPAVQAAAISSLSGHYKQDAADSAYIRPLIDIMQRANPETTVPALKWIDRNQAQPYREQVLALLEATESETRLHAASAIVAIDPTRISTAIETIDKLESDAATRLLVRLLATRNRPEDRTRLYAILSDASNEVRGDVCTTIYQLIGANHRELASVMRFDPIMPVNLSAIRMARRIGDDRFARELFEWCAEHHPNEYIRARALYELEKVGSPRLNELAHLGIASPFWVVRLEAADILSRQAEPDDAERLREALASESDPWLKLALEDALCRAEGKPIPERNPLNLGQRDHTEGGHHPRGFQVWLGGMPKDRDEAQRLVREGYRFGFKVKPPNVPGGPSIRHFNNNKGFRNTFVLETVLEPLEKHRDRLDLMYYVALFDEPGNFRGGWLEYRMRSFLLEAGRPDLLHLIDEVPRDELEAALPGELREAFEYQDARMSGDVSNWAVRVYQMTGQRKYSGLQIFPQTLTYMNRQSFDALDMLETDGDYSWAYHNGNFFRDGAMGGMNRVLNPGKPLNSITWMGWHRPNILNGDRIDASTEFPEGPWRLRGYFGTRSALALWATGSEPGFFSHIGIGKVSAPERPGMPAMAVWLHPWSERAREAVEYAVDDEEHWKYIEGRIAKEQFEARTGGKPDVSDPLGEMEGLDDLQLEDTESPLEKALREKREQMFNRIMTGISYMNIFNTDVTRALSNLPKPDTSPRDSLMILGRDAYWYGDGAFFFMPAVAVLQGWDLAPTYNAVADADLMQYDTILLRYSPHGVTSTLVRKINHWLTHKEGGMLIVWGDVHSNKALFPMVTLDRVDEPFLWEKHVEPKLQPTQTETYKDRRGRSHTRTVYPEIGRVQGPKGGADDQQTQVRWTFSGDIDPLVRDKAGQPVLARWKAPDHVRSVVLFDGAENASPVYTEALEAVVLALDAERGSDVKRNRHWGHTIYENDQFVVDVATRGFESLLDARPRTHQGVDIITGVINPTVHRGECALVLKDYVGPYAGGRGDWAVMARHALRDMSIEAPGRLRVHAEGPTRVTHIGPEKIRLTDAAGFVETENQVELWRLMREGKRGYCVLTIDGGQELHYVSPEPVIILAE